MADKKNKIPDNVPGKFYVDDTCVPCNLCLDEAPGLLKANEDETAVYFFKQPSNPEEESQAAEAMDICPTEAIGSDG